MIKATAIVQARMGSSRLPGKVLMDIGGSPMLARVVERTLLATRLDRAIIATTTLPADDALAALCAERGWPCFRGAADDVLDRYHAAAARFGVRLVARITADCPLLDPRVIDSVVECWEKHASQSTYASNTLPPRTFPRGLDVEVFPVEALALAWREGKSAAAREHVTPYLYDNPGRFTLRSVTCDTDHSRHRWTVDTPEDLELVRKLFSGMTRRDFTWRDVLTLIDRHPEWAALNAGIPQKATG